MTLKLRILRFLTRLFIILVSLTRSLFSEKMLISNRCICGLMSNLIKKSWTGSNCVVYYRGVPSWKSAQPLFYRFNEGTISECKWNKLRSNCALHSGLVRIYLTCFQSDYLPNYILHLILTVRARVPCLLLLVACLMKNNGSIDRKHTWDSKIGAIFAKDSNW